MRCTSQEHCRGLLVAMLRRTLDLGRLVHVGGALSDVQLARQQLARWRKREGAAEFYLEGRAGYNDNDRRGASALTPPVGAPSLPHPLPVGGRAP